LRKLQNAVLVVCAASNAAHLLLLLHATAKQATAHLLLLLHAAAKQATAHLLLLHTSPQKPSRLPSSPQETCRLLAHHATSVPTAQEAAARRPAHGVAMLLPPTQQSAATAEQATAGLLLHSTQSTHGLCALLPAAEQAAAAAQ